MEDLGPKFEDANRCKVSARFATLDAVVKRIQDGESAHVVIVPQEGIYCLVRDGKVVADSVTVIARSGIGVAVRRGALKPDISSPEALKRTFLSARSIAYSDPANGGASGRHFTKVLERLDIINEVKRKAVLAAPGIDTGLRVANGEAELGIHQFQVLVSVPGIEMVGPLPGDLQDTIVFAAAIVKGTTRLDLSRALIDFLRRPESAAVMKAKGMEPAES